jgi:glucoamylase
MEAPGGPGIAPTWASSAKDLVSTALGPSRLWVTLGYGILNEVYWPATGRPQIRDLGFIVAGDGFWAEVKRVNCYTLSTPSPDVPLPTVVHEHERYRLEVEVLPDPLRDVVLIRYQLDGPGLRLYPLLAPHLGGSGRDNTAWVGPEGLLATRGSDALALVAAADFARASAGFVGASDGWQDFHRHGAMTWAFERATAGTVALMGELTDGDGAMALAFASTVAGAVTLARSALAEGDGAIRDRFITGWRAWARGLEIPSPEPALERAARVSAVVLKVHEDRTYPGAVVASLSVPWGNSRDDPGGYHLVWPRDAAEAGLALLACGLTEDAGRMLAYLAATQLPGGHWAQNFSPDGEPYWTGVQLDEAALPVLLAAKLEERGALGPLGAPATAMVRRALRFVARAGPYSPQDRWEENAGANPFTLAVAIAALVAGAELGFLDKADREYALSLADNWNARIEEWTYVERTGLDADHGTRGHYLRVAPPGETAARGRVLIRNRDGEELPARRLVGLEFLYLTRLGLRSPDDSRIQDTLELVEALLRVETPGGAFYHRYNEDGYGEHEDGRPFDGTGVGRAWPLLSGERGHHALVAGADPLPFLRAMAAATSQGGLMPEQVWDAAPIPERGLFPGRPSGSAMPLVWAHAEFLKLLAATRTGRPIEWLESVAARYRRPRAIEVWHWRADTPLERLPLGAELLVEDVAPFVLHLGVDGWQRVHDLEAGPVGLGQYGVRLDPRALGATASLEFTRYLPEGGRWEGQDHGVRLGAS